MRNILFFYPHEFIPEMGGVERVSYSLIKGLTSIGYKIICLHRYNSYKYKISGVNKIYYLPIKEDLFCKENITFYQDILDLNNIDVVINQHGLYEGTYFVNNINGRNVKIISVLHSNPLQSFKYLYNDLSTLRNNTFKEKIKRIVRCIIYPYVRNKIWQSIKNHHDFLLVNKHRVCVLSDSYKNVLKSIDQRYKYGDFSFAIPNPNTYLDLNLNMNEKENTVLFVGRIDNRSKKIFTLLDIWENIDIDDWKLVIVGDGPDKKEVEKKANKIKNIEMVGFKVPDEYYKKASIFCMTSIFEGFPMSLTEAMQNGCVPIIFGSFPAAYDIIKDQESGVIVKPFNKIKYRKELRNIMCNKDKRMFMSQKAKESVNKYNIDNILKLWTSEIER
ncbi:glycosyltransferase [Bacteroides ndongoniae]|uniref:glycosyltransferase n=1 Tax=Bacteroides ndongoniae TaxID=1903262 RepID=UPI0008D924DE|nr:glycosyltransferase [Bacteroides ndongoniae]